MTFDKDQIDEAAAAAPDAETSARLLRAFSEWQTICDYAQKEKKRLSEKCSARKAQFVEAMNVGHANTSDQILKLAVVEQRWQEMEESLDEKKEVTSSLRDQIKASRQKIQDLIEEAKSSQLNLFQSAAEAAADDGDADDESDAD